MRKKRRTTLNKYALQAEYMRITPDHRTPLLEEEILPEAFRFIFIHDGVVNYIDTFGVPEELQVHDTEKNISIPRVSCFIVLVTQLAFQKINRLPTAFKNAVWDGIDDIFLNDDEIPDVILLIVMHYIGEAIEGINHKELTNPQVSDPLWNRIKSVHGSEYAAEDDEIFDNFYEVDVE
jgi:hypothetical protein